MNNKAAKPISAITVDDIPAINAVLAKSDRVELIPTKDGVKVVKIQRAPIKK